MKNLLENIIAKIQLDKNSINVEKKDKRFWIIEGESEVGSVEERYFVYDCSDKDYRFEFEKYKNYMDEEEGISYPIMVFRNWEHEWEVRGTIYNDLGNAADRRKLLKYFEKKASFYTELSDVITLEVEERGCNYLLYDIELKNKIDNEKNMLKGRIYNITFGELKKLFNVTGKDLFRKNVRAGLKNNGTGNSIRRKFKEYIRIGAYYEWIKRQPNDKEVEEIKSLFEIGEEADVRIPEAFWFYHNGITIFYFGDENIDFSGAQIKLNPKKVSVINGAQTMTNYFEGIKEVDLEFKNDVQNLVNEEKINDIQTFFDEYLQAIGYIIKVKTIFIDGDEKYVQPITYGLNTQIPIIEPDIIADSLEVEKINGYLKKGKLKILKGGEVASVGSGFSVLDFVKKYLIVKGLPGKSKNLRRLI